MNTREFKAFVEHCKETGLCTVYVPGFTGAHSQGKTPYELNNLQEVIVMLLEDGKTTKSSCIQPQNNVRKNVAIDTTYNIMS